LEAERPEELPVVGALRTLSIFGPDQRGAYREHFARVAEVLGDDVPTRLGTATREWARAGLPRAYFLTGNAGTGKTAVAEAFCREHGAALPVTDEPAYIAPGCLVVKDLSGLPGPPERLDAVRAALTTVADDGQALVCANEGVLRDALEGLGEEGEALAETLERALREGAAQAEEIVVINVNRQRPTAPELWNALLDYVTREALWEPGCSGCPGEGPGCPMRANADALRKPDVREALRTLVQLGAGEAVPTLREVLAILAWAIVGGSSCRETKERARQGPRWLHRRRRLLRSSTRPRAQGRHNRALATAARNTQILLGEHVRPAGRRVAARHVGGSRPSARACWGPRGGRGGLAFSRRVAVPPRPCADGRRDDDVPRTR
jgi:hypothetical protein